MYNLSLTSGCWCLCKGKISKHKCYFNVYWSLSDSQLIIYPTQGTKENGNIYLSGHGCKEMSKADNNWRTNISSRGSLFKTCLEQLNIEGRYKNFFLFKRICPLVVSTI